MSVDQHVLTDAEIHAEEQKTGIEAPKSPKTDGADPRISTIAWALTGQGIMVVRGK